MCYTALRHALTGLRHGGHPDEKYQVGWLPLGGWSDHVSNLKYGTCSTAVWGHRLVRRHTPLMRLGDPLVDLTVHSLLCVFAQAVQCSVLNPKCVKLGELYGECNELTNEWTDGLVRALFRSVLPINGHGLECFRDGVQQAQQSAIRAPAREGRKPPCTPGFLLAGKHADTRCSGGHDA